MSMNKKIYKPRFPVYVVSKDRWDIKMTAYMLGNIGVDYYLVVEKHEYKKYCENFPKENILILPKKYLKEYDTFWPRGEDNKTGPGAARNFCWDHSIKNGHKWHWVMDDNIPYIRRFNNNMRVTCVTATPFYVIEDFVLRYKNIGISGMGYTFFCPINEARPPINLNTRIYSCLLIRNDIPFRWRGRYNEDTDLCLRVMKAGWVTVEFNAFLIEKMATQTVKGGNTSEFYSGEGTENKSQILVDMHPDVTTLVERFGRWHHLVNYKPFKKNKLILKDGLVIPDEVNNFGLKIRKKKRKW